MAENKAENKIKSIANCKPSEFLKQTNAIRHYVEKWLKLIKFSDIRKHLPTVPDGATDEEVNELIREQNHKNFSDMLDAALDQYPEETIGVLALCCFLPAEDADNHPVDMYIEVIADLMESENVMRFFISLAKLGLRLGK